MNLKIVVLLAVVVAAVECHPRYIAVPVEDLRLVRHVRSLPAYPRAQARSDAGFQSRRQIDADFQPRQQIDADYQPRQQIDAGFQETRQIPVFQSRPQIDADFQPRPQIDEGFQPRPQIDAGFQETRQIPVFQSRPQIDSGFQETRQIPSFQQVLPPVVELRHAEPQASERYERQSGGYGGNDHVDYGAYTGGYGAFGWYSDHPVCVNCGYGYH